MATPPTVVRVQISPSSADCRRSKSTATARVRRGAAGSSPIDGNAVSPFLEEWEGVKAKTWNHNAACVELIPPSIKREKGVIDLVVISGNVDPFHPVSLALPSFDVRII